MNFKLYLRRAIKSVLYIAIVFFLLLVLMYVFSEKKNPDTNFFDLMIPKQNRLPLFGFIVVFGFAYPFITFVKKNVYLNKTFEEERNNVLRVFETSGYELVGEADKKILFRPKNKVSRFMRMMEDTVEVDYSNNPIIVSGMRKEIYRLSKHIEYLSLNQNTEN